MNKNLKIVLVVLVVLLALGLGGFFILRGKKDSGPPGPPEQEGKLIETALEERPYVTMTPRADGKEFTLEISRIQNAKTIDYELVYFSQGMSRGVIGSATLRGGETQISRDLLLGTCSKNVCKYDEGVTEGTLTIKFRSDEGVRKFTSDFSLQQGDDKLTSQDGNFTLEGKLSATAFYLTMPTIGLPAEVEGEVLVGPYGVFSAGSQAVSSGQLTLSLSEANPEAQLYAWDGKSWEELKSAEVESNEVTASVTSLGTFLVSASETTMEPSEAAK